MRPIKQPAFPFVNAQAMAAQFPDTFQAPSAEELASLHRGRYVKVCIDRIAVSEQFWVSVESVDGDVITGEISSTLKYELFHNLQCGDLVQFKLENVYSITD